MRRNSDRDKVAVLREGWLAAIASADTDRLVSMVTDDVVIVHGDGRCIRGKDEFKADLVKGFQSYRIRQRVLDPKVTIRDNWAFEIASVESSLAPSHGSETIRAVTTTLVVLRRQADGSWKVARVIGLIDSKTSQSQVHD